ncbi:E3 ubiquitin/ISG15 ligase TRIM25 isoform X2 [Trichomycterus rosablanca]
MAAAATISVDEEHFSCPVCLEILRDPVTIPCGHSYCMGCIKGYWRKTEHKSGYSCPQCRKIFNPRPVLARNTVLAGVVEKLKEAAVQEISLARAGEVECDVCQGRKSRAVKSCVKCQASYCEVHLKQHNERDRNKTHKVAEVTKQLHKKVCNQHSRLFELYCRTDQQLICPLCVTDGHSGHQTVAAAEERSEKQRLLEEAFKRSKQKIKEKEKELMTFIKYLKRSSQAVESDSEKICSKLLRSVERRHIEVKELLRAEERAAISQVEEILELLEQQTEDHRRREAELEQLSHTDDHIHFLLKCKTCVPADPVELGIDVHPYFSLMILRRAITELRERVNDVCDRELARIAVLIKDESSPSAETSPSVPICPEIVADPGRIKLKSRAEFLHYCCDLVLDQNTANSYLCLSEGNRKVSACYESQHYPEHPDRFSSWTQVLGREGLSSRCYWEVEWSGYGGIAVGVSYKNINRHGGSADGKLGCNPKSWCLDISDG